MSRALSEEGDFLGIIGTNGAGKSTLLKVISGIIKPAKGSVTVNGKIAALLELGSGFDGDLTLKENIYLRGAMLGYTREFVEIHARLFLAAFLSREMSGIKNCGRITYIFGYLYETSTIPAL